MPGDPACWSHLFYEDENAEDSEPMTKTTAASNGKGAIPADLRKFLSDNDARIRDELFDFLRIPSVSASSEHNADTAARRRVGRRRRSTRSACRRRSIRPPGHPIVVGEWRNAPGRADGSRLRPLRRAAGRAARSVDSRRRSSRRCATASIFARGSVDDKGQLFLHIKALEAHLADARQAARQRHRARRGRGGGRQRAPRGVHRGARRSCSRADAVVISDSAMFAPGLPSILSSLRGLAYFQIDVQGPPAICTPGSYGGAVVNPAMALARILATLHDDERPHRDPGLLRQGARLGPKIARSRCKRAPVRRRRLSRRRPASPALGGEKGYTTLEQLWIASDLRGERAAERLHRRRREDGAAGEGDGEGELPPRARSGSGGDREADAGARGERVAPKGVTVTVAASARRPSVARRARMARCSTRRGARCARRSASEPVITGEGGSIPVVGDFRAHPRRAGAAGRLRTAGRERARAGRVDERGEFQEGHARDGDAVGRVRRGRGKR